LYKPLIEVVTTTQPTETKESTNKSAEKKEFENCQLCPMKYLTKQSLLRHIKMEHDNIEDTHSTDSTVHVGSNRPNSMQPFQTITVGKTGIKKVELHSTNNAEKARKIPEVLNTKHEGIRITSVMGNVTMPTITKNGNNKEQLECVICNQQMSPKEEDVFRHSKTHTGATYNGTVLIDQIPCMLCEEIFESPPTLRTHIKEKYGEIFKKTASTGGVKVIKTSHASLPDKSTPTPPIKTESCPLDSCHYKGVNKKNLSSHFNNIHKRKLSEAFPCETCPEAYDKKDLLSTHVQAKHMKLGIAKEDEVTITKRKVDSFEEPTMNGHHQISFPNSLKILKVEVESKI